MYNNIDTNSINVLSMISKDVKKRFLVEFITN